MVRFWKSFPMPTLKSYLAAALLLISALSLAVFEYVLEHDRPVRSQAPFTLYHKGYGAIVYVTNSDQLLYWGLSMACIASALFLAYRAFNRIKPLA